MRALHLFACCLLGLPAFGFLRLPRFHTFVHLSASSSGISSTDQLSGSSSIGSTEKSVGSDDAESLTDKPVLGRPHTATSRAKIAAKNKGKVPWNVGKAHSDETRKLIAEKTREAMLRRKLEKLDALGMTLEDYDQERVQRKRERKQAMRTGLTIEGRQRISESVKRRWQDPEFRRHYTVTNRGARNHSEATRAKISEAITLKWKDVDYRAKVRRNPTLEERARISATLKLKWRDPDFRDRMLNHSFPRTDEWRNLVSEKIREKWQDPTYRESVTSAIRASNRTGPSGSGGKVRLRPSRAPTPRRPRQSPDEVKARKRAARQALKEKNTARKEAFKVAKQAAQRSGGPTRLKELLGRELWFEEKVRACPPPPFLPMPFRPHPPPPKPPSTPPAHPLSLLPPLMNAAR